jgi:hypothetical protein
MKQTDVANAEENGTVPPAGESQQGFRQDTLPRLSFSTSPDPPRRLSSDAGTIHGARSFDETRVMSLPLLE